MVLPLSHMSSPSASPGSAEGSYSAWVRSALAAMSASRGRCISLFESSVPEPSDLLRTTIVSAFGDAMPTRYVSPFVQGNPYVVEQLERRYSVTADSILCTTGASAALFLLYRTLLDPGTRVLTENPGFDLFSTFAQALNVPVDRFERNPHDLGIDPDRVAAALHPKTRLIVLSNLHNPSGALAADSDIREIARLAAKQGAVVIVDEVYRDYVPASAAQVAATCGPNVVQVSSLTKIYGLSTLRCGWIVGDPTIIARARALQDELEFGISKLGHAVAALVLENSRPYDEFTHRCLGLARPVLERYHRLWREEHLVEGELPPHGCIYFPRLVGILDSSTFAARLAREHGIFVAPGKFFGAPGHVRIGFAVEPAALESGLAGFTSALRAHRGEK